MGGASPAHFQQAVEQLVGHGDDLHIGLVHLLVLHQVHRLFVGVDRAGGAPVRFRLVAHRLRRLIGGIVLLAVHGQLTPAGCTHPPAARSCPPCRCHRGHRCSRPCSARQSAPATVLSPTLAGSPDRPSCSGVMPALTVSMAGVEVASNFKQVGPCRTIGAIARLQHGICFRWQ